MEEINDYLEEIKEQYQKKELTTMSIFGVENDSKNNDAKKNTNKEEENIIIDDEEEENNPNNKETEIMIIEEDNNNTTINENKSKNNKTHRTNKNKNSINSDEDEKEKRKKNNEKNEENESKKEKKVKKRVRGPNKCYRIIDEFFTDKKRAKNTNENNNNELNKEESNLANDDQVNEEDKKNDENKNKRIKKRIKVTEMSEKFDEFLNFVNERVNKDYYDIFIYPVINNYKEFYIEKEKEFKENKNAKQNNNNDEKSNNINNNIDENLARKKKSYGLENFLEIPEIVNDFVKYIYNKNIFVTDESKIEMIEIIFIFCTWLKQYHYSSYSIEYLINNE